MKTERGMIGAGNLAILFLGLAILVFAAANRNTTQGPAPASANVPAVSKANNLRFVDCNKHLSGLPGLVEIPVDAAEGIARENEVVFACTGEKVRWAVSAEGAPKVESFRVEFQNNESPFLDGATTFSGNGATATAQGEVKSLGANLHSKPYKYMITVNRKDGNVVRLDPVFIPMGN